MSPRSISLDAGMADARAEAGMVGKHPAGAVPISRAPSRRQARNCESPVRSRWGEEVPYSGTSTNGNGGCVGIKAHADRTGNDDDGDKADAQESGEVVTDGDQSTGRSSDRQGSLALQGTVAAGGAAVEEAVGQGANERGEKKVVSRIERVLSKIPLSKLKIIIGKNPFSLS